MRRIKTLIHYRNLVLVVILQVSLSPIAVAEDAGSGGMSMEEANQAMANPITSYTMFIMENDNAFLNGDLTDGTEYANVTLIEPLIPVSIGDTGWNLVNRPVIPIIATAPVPTGVPGDFDQKSALGDVVFFSLLKPPSTGHFQWGVGPTFTLPTASNDKLGSEKWSAGPAGIALYTSPKDTYGVLAQQWWSFAGESDREDVSKMSLQYFFIHNFNEKWAFITAPTISANWNASSGNRWSVPISAGVAYSFKLGKRHVRIVLEPQYFVVQPDAFGAEWNIRLAFAMVLPKL